MNKGKRIVILGGGTGGVFASYELRKLLGKEHQITLIEKNSNYAFPSSFLWLMIGERKPEEIVSPLTKMLPKGIEPVFGEIRSIDLKNREVEVNSNKISGDYLIVALGAELMKEPFGLKNYHTFYTYEGSIKLRDALEKFKGGTVGIVVASSPYKCPGAPHEGAMLLDAYFKKRGIREKTEIHLFTPESQPLPAAGQVLGEAVQKLLEWKGIKFHPLYKPIKFGPGENEISFEGKGNVKLDLLILIPPHQGSHIVKVSGLSGQGDWIPVNRQTLETQYENIYAIGDAASVTLPGKWKSDLPLSLPKAGVFAHTGAKAAARRIAAAVGGETPTETMQGEGYCMLEMGNGIAGFAYGNFYGEPSPEVNLKTPGKFWHYGKALFEKWWLSPPGLRRFILGEMIEIGSKMAGIPSAV